MNSKSVYGNDEKYIKTQIKTYGDSVITNFHIKKIPTQKAPCKCLSIIMLDSVIKTKKNYYLQTLLVELTRTNKNRELYWWWFRKSESNESGIDNGKW